MGQLFTQVLGMGAAAIPMLRDMLQQNGQGHAGGGAKPAPAARRKSPPAPAGTTVERADEDL
jgi:hypothetical protein